MVIWYRPIWIDALSGKVSIQEIQKILDQLGFPQAFNTEQTAICVISLFDNHPKLLRIHDIIVHARKHLGKDYAENTRESIRKLSLKRLVNHGLAIFNKDDPSRSINSGKWNQCLTDEFYTILKSSQKDRPSLIKAWTKLHKNLKENSIDTTHKVSIKISDNKHLDLSPGPHNTLERHIIENLVRSKIKQPEVVYVGDTKKKMLYVNEDLVAKLGIILDKHDKLPDVIVWSKLDKKFFVIESVTSVGPVEESRKSEINNIINKKAGKNYSIVYITAFLDRKTFAKFSSKIASDSFVWIAAEPDGLIHFSKKGIDL